MNLILFVGEKQPYINDAYTVRQTVFTEEQGFDAAIDLDQYDQLATHVLIYDEQQQPIATARTIPFYEKNNSIVKIGRVAVLFPYRKQGLGKKVMQALMDKAINNQVKEIRLSAQLTALSFYHRLGYQTVGEMYLEEGVEHILMSYRV